MIFKIILIFGRLSRNGNGIKIETSENKKATQDKADNKNGKKDGQNHGSRADDPQKYAIYFSFSAYINNIHSHQTLAINRAENSKVNWHSSVINFFKYQSFVLIQFFCSHTVFKR